MSTTTRRGISLARIMASPVSLNLMYVPALTLFAVFIVYPLSQGLKWSLTNWNGYSPHYAWVGWQQYARMFADPKALRAITNTFIYGVGSTLLQNVLGLAYALFLNGTSRAKGLVRTIVYFPIIISPLIMGYVWYFMFQYDGGAINDILILFGRAPLDWLGNGARAVWLMTLVNTYQFMGVAMIIYLAARQDAGYAAAMGNLMFTIITVISISLLAYLRRREVDL